MNNKRMQNIKFALGLEKDNFLFNNNRKSATRNLLSVTVSIIFGIICALLIATMVGQDPFAIIAGLFKYGFNNPNLLIINFATLGIAASAFAFAFKAKIFNIGISGQMLASGITALAVANSLKDTTSGGGQLLMIIIVLIVGTLMGSIVGVLKTYCKVNEVISSIMINWIVFYVCRDFLSRSVENGGLGNASGGNPSTGSILFTQNFAFNGASGDQGWIAAILIFILIVAFMIVIFKFTSFGSKIITVGNNSDAAKYAGYNVNLITISTLSISGAMAGLLAIIVYMSPSTAQIPYDSSAAVLPTEGYDGITIALIGLSNPIGIIPISFLMAMFKSSAELLPTQSTFNGLITGLIMLGATLYVLVVVYKPWIFIKSKIYGRKSTDAYYKYSNDMNLLISVTKTKLSILKEISKLILYLKVFKINKLLLKKLNNNYKKITNLLTEEQKKLYDNKLSEYNNQSDLILILKELKDTINNKIKSDYNLEKNNITNKYHERLILSKGMQYFYPDQEVTFFYKEYESKLFKQKSMSNAKYQSKISSYLNSINDLSSNSELNQTKINELKNKINLCENKIKQNNDQYVRWLNEYKKTKLDKIYKKIINISDLDKIKEKLISMTNKLTDSSNEKKYLLEWIDQGYESRKNTLLNKEAN